MRKMGLVLLFLSAVAGVWARAMSLDDVLSLVELGKLRFSRKGRFGLFLTHRYWDRGKGPRGWQWKTLSPSRNYVRNLVIPGFPPPYRPRWSPSKDGLYFMKTKDRKGPLYFFSTLTNRSYSRFRFDKPVYDYRIMPDDSGILYTLRRFRSQDALDAHEESHRPRPYSSLFHYHFRRRKHTCLLSSDIFIQKIRISRQGVVAIEYLPEGIKNRILSDIGLYDLNTHRFRIIIKNTGVDQICGWSNNGRYLSYYSSGQETGWSYHRCLFIFDTQNSTSTRITLPTDGGVSAAEWLPDSKGLCFIKHNGVINELWQSGLTGPGKRLSPAGQSISGFTLNPVNRREVIFIKEDFDRPAELYRGDLSHFAKNQRCLSSINKHLTGLTYGRTFAVQWPSRQNIGGTVEGLITLPVGHQKGDRVPFVVYLHGGPAKHFRKQFTGARFPVPIQVLAAKGFGVFMPNPRGSSGYGSTFRTALEGDWGGVDYGDVIDGVDYIIQSGYADPRRIGIAGWSYGGYLAAWAVSQTRRFKAAAAGAAITHLTSYIGQVDIPEFVESYIGTPEKKLAFFAARSPVSFARHIRTPLLLIHGARDTRVPPSQSRELFRALKRQNQSVRFFLIPEMGHAPSWAQHYRYSSERLVEWFRKYLK